MLRRMVPIWYHDTNRTAVQQWGLNKAITRDKAGQNRLVTTENANMAATALYCSGPHLVHIYVPGMISP